MPVGRPKGYKLSKETKEKMSKSHKGNVGYWNGRKFSKEHKEKLSKSHSGNKSYRWNGGKVKKDKGYILIYSPNHPNYDSRKYVLEHRLITEKCLGRYLTKEEVIHHINGIKDDNRPKNLYLFESTSEHTKFHHLKNKPILKSNIIKI